MLATPTCIYVIKRKKPCIKKPDALDCAIRHTRCEGCPFKDFFKPDKSPKIDNVQEGL